jgi:hypothetical protein
MRFKSENLAAQICDLPWPNQWARCVNFLGQYINLDPTPVVENEGGTGTCELVLIREHPLRKAAVHFVKRQCRYPLRDVL